jgi:anti-sigma B factor antagonist
LRAVRSQGYYLAEGLLSEATYRVGAGGELDLASRYELSDALDRAVDSGAKTLELDLTLVSFIDSTAIKVIARAARQLRARGCQMELTVGNRNVFRVFEITGLDRLVEVTFALPPVTMEPVP